LDHLAHLVRDNADVFDNRPCTYEGALARLSPLRRGFVLGFLRAKRQGRKELARQAADFDAELLVPRRPDWPKSGGRAFS